GLVAKRLELLLMLVPNAATFGFLVNRGNPNAAMQSRDAEEAARLAGVRMNIVAAGEESELEGAFSSLARERADALIVGADLFLYGHREQVVALAAKYAIPAIYTVPDYAAAGGLITYTGSSDDRVIDELLGRYAGRLLNGEKPADMPVVLPT